MTLFIKVLLRRRELELFLLGQGIRRFVHDFILRSKAGSDAALSYVEKNARDKAPYVVSLANKSSTILYHTCILEVRKNFNSASDSA